MCLVYSFLIKKFCLIEGIVAAACSYVIFNAKYLFEDFCIKKENNIHISRIATVGVGYLTILNYLNFNSIEFLFTLMHIDFMSRPWFYIEAIIALIIFVKIYHVIYIYREVIRIIFLWLCAVFLLYIFVQFILNFDAVMSYTHKLFSEILIFPRSGR